MAFFEKIKEIFGEVAGAQSGNDCMKNAVHNAALTVASGDEPAIFDVETSVGRHAYLGVGTEVASQGVTWMTDFYPELSQDQILALGGQDVTAQLLSQALNPEDDRYGYHRVLDRLETEIPDIKGRVAQYLQRK